MSNLVFDYNSLKLQLVDSNLISQDNFELFYKHFYNYKFPINIETSRFTDQKNTIDILKIIVETIINLPSANINFDFSKIKNSSSFESKICKCFQKPNPKSRSPREFDKVISQPLNLLFFSKILKRELKGNKYIYYIPNLDTIEMKILSLLVNEDNVVVFLFMYYIKTFTDSKCLAYFNNYYNQDVKTNKEFSILKENYSLFIKDNTKIKQNLEIVRIFNKIFNLISYVLGESASKGGRLSTTISINELRYNKINFRDIGKKHKSQSRQEMSTNKIFLDNSSKYKRKIKELHYPNSEFFEINSGKATQVHHISPEHIFPELSNYLENLILLTPDQHNIKAHPNNKTKEIDFDYQLKFFISKLESIQNNPNFYSIEKFCHVLNITTNSNEFNHFMNINDIKNKLMELYKKKIPEKVFADRYNKIMSLR